MSLQIVNFSGQTMFHCSMHTGVEKLGSLCAIKISIEVQSGKPPERQLFRISSHLDTKLFQLQAVDLFVLGQFSQQILHLAEAIQGGELG